MTDRKRPTTRGATTAERLDEIERRLGVIEAQTKAASLGLWVVPELHVGRLVVERPDGEHRIVLSAESDSSSLYVYVPGGGEESGIALVTSREATPSFAELSLFMRDRECAQLGAEDRPVGHGLPKGRLVLSDGRYDESGERVVLAPDEPWLREAQELVP